MKGLFALGCLLLACCCKSQNLVAAAAHFITTLDRAQKTKAFYPFTSEERYNWHFVPMDNRNGISLNELKPEQRAAALQLLRASLSETGYQKAQAIRQLEPVLKVLEKRSDDDQYRDSGKYFITIFGVPGAKTIWGWRFEGHHISFTFSAAKDKLISGTPAFMGANPGIVREGPKKGTQVLKEEAEAAFTLLHTLSPTQVSQALIDTTAPAEIITFVSRKAMIEHPQGIRYSALDAAQQQQLLQLIGVYVHRYTKLFAGAMLKEIQDAGLENLRFGWAGATDAAAGKPHYYRIQGPTIIIEYDNSQNGANHPHTVLRDLKSDFGGDMLMEHYKTAHH